jgi:hypothetical protein
MVDKTGALNMETLILSKAAMLLHVIAVETDGAPVEYKTFAHIATLSSHRIFPRQSAGHCLLSGWP